MAPSSPKVPALWREHSNCTLGAQRAVDSKLRPPRNSAFGLFVRRMGRTDSAYYGNFSPNSVHLCSDRVARRNQSACLSWRCYAHSFTNGGKRNTCNQQTQHHALRVGHVMGFGTVMWHIFGRKACRRLRSDGMSFERSTISRPLCTNGLWTIPRRM